jgi:6-phosphogluconate dehydrogenase
LPHCRIDYLVSSANKYIQGVPGFASALSYYDALRTERLPAALIQGQRDFFGAHTYGRTDADPAARFHTQWSGDRTEVQA